MCFRDCKLKNVLGPSALAFSLPNKKEFPTALESLETLWLMAQQTHSLYSVPVFPVNKSLQTIFSVSRLLLSYLIPAQIIKAI
jgi:hypothetical protein